MGFLLETEKVQRHGDSELNRNAVFYYRFT